MQLGTLQYGKRGWMKKTKSSIQSSAPHTISRYDLCECGHDAQWHGAVGTPKPVNQKTWCSMSSLEYLYGDTGGAEYTICHCTMFKESFESVVKEARKE